MLTSPLGLLLIAVLVYLVRDWRKKEKARQAAKQWEDDNNPVKVAEWLDAEMCKQDPDWRKHLAEEEAAKEAAYVAYSAAQRAAHPEEYAAYDAVYEKQSREARATWDAAHPEEAAARDKRVAAWTAAQCSR